MSENRRRNSQSPGLTMKEIAELVGGKLEGDGGLWVSGIGPVDEADAGQMAFLARKRYVRYVPGSRASSFLVSSDLQVYVPSHVPRIIVEEPYRALRTLLKRFHPPQPHSARVHPTAVIGLGVELGNGVSVGPYAVIEDDAQIGDGCRIGPHCVIGRGSSLGKECLLHPQVVTYEETVIGDRVVVHSGVRLGSDGFGFTLVDDVHLKIPQVGRCVIEDDVEIGANATIDRGSLGDTVVGRGSKTDNLVHLAHNVKVGAGSLFAALVGVS
ncbi:MAG: UDP-3-O-(3-hydroxymyristoyl)glucosamine N-acyltransferase, partial [Gemmatimonadota bacterium]|nr:UDP-3-O-(3-hydroxymyristoyl)glucosamine N-acyltransferase [Gemmatimonadota bacterium]